MKLYPKIGQEESKALPILPDETPNKKETIIGLLLGVGYLTVFVLLPFLLLSLFFKDVDPNILSTVAQLLTAMVVIILMIINSKRTYPTVIAGFNRDVIRKGALYGVIMYGVAIAYSLIDIWIFGEPVVNANQAALNALAQQAPLLFIVFTCLVAPVVEELIFRYYLYKPLEKKGVVLAIIVSAFLFAAIHMTSSFAAGTIAEDLRSFPAYLIPSLIFGIAYYRTKHVATTITAHVVYNTITVIALFLSNGPAI